MKYSTAITIKAFYILLNWLIRDNWEIAKAQEEVSRLKKLGINNAQSRDEIAELYLTARRTGSKFKMNRKDRRELLLLLDNAFKHSTYEVLYHEK